MVERGVEIFQRWTGVTGQKMEISMSMDGPIDSRMGYNPYGSYGPYRMGGFSGSETVPSHRRGSALPSFN